MDKHDEVKEWILYANNDLEAVHQLLTFNPPKIEIICYHCQQSAEKMLKAFWVYFEIKPPKTHELHLLLEKCKEIDASFGKIAEECSRLNIYSSQPRYPLGLEITESDMQVAIKDCETICKFIKNKII